MAQVKLDHSKPFGVVYGHDEYQFFQGGLYFDGMEMSIEPRDDSVPALILRSERQPEAIESAKKFLAQILKEGPIMKSAIFKEAEMNNQPWEAVTAARVLMGITEAKGPGGNLRWRLPEDLA